MRRARFFLQIAAIALAGAACSGVNTPQGGGTPKVTITIAPKSTNVIVSQNALFTATVTGSTNTGANWQVNGVTGGSAATGTINTSGVYTAPATVPNPPTVTVTAIAQADATKTDSAQAQIIETNPNQLKQSTPVKLGTSGGNSTDSSKQGNATFCCSGTLGALLARNGSFYVLSNNHVLAKSDTAAAGDAITQPGLIDANCSAATTTTVANLTQFVNLETSGANADAAMGLIVSGAVDTAGTILSLGATATGSTPDDGPPHRGNGILAIIGESVAKSGRSSGLTCSTVAAIHVNTTVSYQKGCNTGSTFNVTFTGQISIAGGTFSTGGDSGSLIVDQNTADPVALLYAGSDTDTVGNPVADVLLALADGMGNQPSFVGSASTHQVIGCTLLANGVKTVETQVSVALDPSAVSLAERARDMHAPELLANVYIQAIGVGPSIDHPGKAALLLVVNPGQKATSLPSELEGVRTRIVTAGSAAPHGIFALETGMGVAPAKDVFAVNAIAKAEVQRAMAVHIAHVNELMKQPGVQGVGITSSADAPGEAALIIYLVRGEKHNDVPITIDGVRTRVRESSRFIAGNRGEEPLRGCSVPALESRKASVQQ
jgi:hypothetical protein